MCVYCVKCTKFGKLFLRKVIKTVATRCLDFSSKPPKCVWRPGSARTRWGSLSAPPDPIAAKRGPTSKGRGGKGGRGWEGGGGKGWEWKGGEGRDFAGPIKIWLLRPCLCTRYRSSISYRFLYDKYTAVLKAGDVIHYDRRSVCANMQSAILCYYFCLSVQCPHCVETIAHIV